MKLVRYGETGAEQPGLWLDCVPEMEGPAILNVRGMAFDIEDYNEHFFGRQGIQSLGSLVKESRRKLISAQGVRLGPPVARPSKIICLGKNYAEHAREFDSKIPESPILFSKATTSMVGPFDDIRLPAESGVVDGEVELALVIGKRARRVRPEDAYDYIAGYTVLNDVTDRTVQRAAGQWFRGKSDDTFCPVGPFLVTPDEVGDPHALRLVSKLNGRILQNGTTADMIFKIPAILASITATQTLLPGDIIATGTPAGIGSVQQPPQVLKAGDLCETEVEKLGTQRCHVKAES